MRRKLFKRVLMFATIAVLAATVFSFLLMTLWNWLVPEVFGGRAITIGQAFGLLVLSRILFGGFRPGGGPPGWRRRMRERWERMTPEEREKFRQGLRGRCGWDSMKEPAQKQPSPEAPSNLAQPS